MVGTVESETRTDRGSATLPEARRVHCTFATKEKRPALVLQQRCVATVADHISCFSFFVTFGLISPPTLPRTTPSRAIPLVTHNMAFGSDRSNPVPLSDSLCAFTHSSTTWPPSQDHPANDQHDPQSRTSAVAASRPQSIHLCHRMLAMPSLQVLCATPAKTPRASSSQPPAAAELHTRQ